MVKKFKAIWRISCLLTLAFVLIAQPLIINHPNTARAYDYGYAIGDQFCYTDSLIETLTSSEHQLSEESHHQYEIKIEAIDEDTANYTIRLTVHFANLSQGIENYTTTQFMEGFTPIVAGPRVYFTHTNWNSHHIDWLMSIENFQFSTQMTGDWLEDENNHIYSWLFTKFVNSSLSIVDIDSDGQTDGYNITNMYTAHFTDQGVLVVRKFFNDIHYDNGARYTRLRQILLTFPLILPSFPGKEERMHSLISAEELYSLSVLMMISFIIALSIGLGGFTFFGLLKNTKKQRKEAA